MKRTAMKRTAMIFLVSALGYGCGLTGSNNDMRQIEVALASATTLGQSASLALNAMNGSGSTLCTSVNTACTDYPCAGEVSIQYGAGCPLPLGGEAIGVTTVTGMWSSGTEASLDFSFTEVKVGERYGMLASATSISATQADGITTLRYSGASAGARGVVAVSSTSNWTVEVNDSGTPDDPSDDSYLVDGSSTAVGGTNALVISVRDVVITPDCRRNPLGGTARLTQSGLNVRTDEITFLTSCDGIATLEPTLGGERMIELDFLED